MDWIILSIIAFGGVAAGWVFCSLFTAAKIEDLQDKLDFLEAATAMRGKTIPWSEVLSRIGGQEPEEPDPIEHIREAMRQAEIRERFNEQCG